MPLAASASPASPDSDIIPISISSLSPSSQFRSYTHNRRRRYHHQHNQPVHQPPSSASNPLPPARSSSPRHHARVSAPASPHSHPQRRQSLSSSSHSHSYSASRQLAGYFSEWADGSTTAHTHQQPSSFLSPLAHALFDDDYEFFEPHLSSPLFCPSSANTPLRLDTDDDDDDNNDNNDNNDNDNDDDIGAGVMPISPCLGRPLDADADHVDVDAQTTTQTSQCFGRSSDYAYDLPSLQLQGGHSSASTTQHTDFTLDSQRAPPFFDVADQGAADTSFTEQPSVMTRAAAAAAAAAATTTTTSRPDTHSLGSSKRRRFSQRQQNQSRFQNETSVSTGLEQDLFGDAIQDEDIADENMTTIDLTETNQVPPELTQPIVDNRIKISAFQCAICMDDVTGLTVTYCGHLFCALCLHHSLDVESTKGRCPMCRAKIDIKPRQSYTAKTKGFWPLELKLMTASKRGKRKAEAISNQ